MSNKIGRFEIQSEISRSDSSCVYKALDTETAQTVALKTLRLEILGDQAQGVMQQVLEEADAAKVLNSPNIAGLYGVGDIDQLFCASMEYVQGNSIATMLARKEGFSIWDLQDIARQSCQGLDHAHARNVFHYCLEPAKIMVQWDGTVKLLSFGLSTMTAFAAQASGPAPEVLHYMSPEQLHGDPLDARSNIFTLGAILYEMVTEQKPFPGETAEQVRQQILEHAPKPPADINRKLHPALNDLIMKALSKSPEERYQSGQELVNDLEKCKETSTKAAAASTSAQPAKGLTAPQAVKPATAKPAAVPAAKPATAAPKAAAAAAGVGGSKSTTVVKASTQMTKPTTSVSAPQPKMSSAIAEPEVESPKVAVDPMMDESASTSSSASHSFSEIDELPPLKEIYIAPESVPEPVVPPSAAHDKAQAADKQKVQPREVAKKAVAEIRKTPPKLFIYAIAGAVGIILLIVGMIAYGIHRQNTEDSGPPPAAEDASTAAQTSPEPSQPAAPVQSAPEPAQSAPAIAVKPRYAPRKKGEKAPAPAAPAIVPGQLTVNSNPEGAQVQIDGRSDTAWVTPFNLSGVAPGQHTAVISKPGYVSQTHTIDVGSGRKSFVALQLVALSAAVLVNSEPAGAVVVIDGRDSGRLTPTQLSVDKPGNHTILVRREGYLEETTTLNLQLGQTMHYSPTLRPLGSTDEIKTVSKFKKVFRSGDAAGMGTVSIKTNPKGAQIAINQRLLDKSSPVEFYLNPGNYVVDITLSGYKGVHKVITVDKNGKVAVDENLERQ